MEGKIGFFSFFLITIISVLSGCMNDNKNTDQVEDIDTEYPIQLPSDPINQALLSSLRHEIGTSIDNYSIYVEEKVDCVDRDMIHYDYFFGMIFEKIRSVIVYYNSTSDTIDVWCDYTPIDESEVIAYSVIAFSKTAPHFMVPISCEKKSSSIYEVKYVDGWDFGCGHLSYGYADVDIQLRTFELTSHVE
jgi:hypothetical protein